MLLIILTVQRRDRLGERGVGTRGGHSPWLPMRGGSPWKGYLFQALGILKCRDSTCWSIENGREICHLRQWKGPNGLTDEFYQFCGFVKSRKHSLIFVIDSYLKDSAFTPVKRDMQSSKQGMWKGYHCQRKVNEKGYLFREKWYIKGWVVGPRSGASAYKH